MSFRPAAVAGMFYPENPKELSTLIRAQLQGQVKDTARAVPVKALIVPHAGLIYSGPVAASAYRLLQASDPPLRRVLLLGPSHRVAFTGMAIPELDCEAFETPLGRIPLDTAYMQKIFKAGLLQTNNAAHALEHSLEVQLPFLQTVLGHFELVPVVVGDASTREVEDLLQTAMEESETLIVISSDLSHYHPYEQARRIDSETCAEITQLHPVLDGEQACGCRGVNGLLALADRAGLQPELLDYRNSGDTAGSRDQVVGYAAFRFH